MRRHTRVIGEHRRGGRHLRHRLRQERRGPRRKTLPHLQHSGLGNIVAQSLYMYIQGRVRGPLGRVLFQFY
jgi:hypothetical protein